MALVFRYWFAIMCFPNQVPAIGRCRSRICALPFLTRSKYSRPEPNPDGFPEWINPKRGGVNS
jgi:hypothetical protein